MACSAEPGATWLRSALQPSLRRDSRTHGSATNSTDFTEQNKPGLRYRWGFINILPKMFVLPWVSAASTLSLMSEMTNHLMM